MNKIFARIREIKRTDLFVGIVVAIAIIAVIVFLSWLIGGSGSVIVSNQNPSSDKNRVSTIAGIKCARAEDRPIAVMLASDTEARPLSGIGGADLVFEMPVTPNGITRLMAVFQCTLPLEIGSIRSAREDFIPLAEGIDAILAHWGGERGVLVTLDSGIIDNVDAMKYEGSTFYRKNNIPRPHNGFTAPDLLFSRAQELEYRASTSLSGIFERGSTSDKRGVTNTGDRILLPWPLEMGVEFKYDQKTRMYSRWRNGTSEIDRLTGIQVSVPVVAVLSSSMEFRYDQYVTMHVIGSGNADVYQGGIRTTGRWEKASASAPLKLTKQDGSSIILNPGKTWIIFNAPLLNP